MEMEGRERKEKEREGGREGGRLMSIRWMSEENASVKWKLISCDSF